MLLTREEMAFDFGGAKLDPVHDRATRSVVVWAVQQFLYGEVTGIQIGHWLYQRAGPRGGALLLPPGGRGVPARRQLPPHPRDPRRRAGARPRAPVRFLATGLMGGDWAEHVAMEMALGEGLVLQAFYAMIETVDDEEIVAILKRGGEAGGAARRVRRAAARCRRSRASPGSGAGSSGSRWSRSGASSRLESVMKARLPMDHPALRSSRRSCVTR